MHLVPIQDFFHKKYAHPITKLILGPQDLQTAALWQRLARGWWKSPILEGSLIQKPT